MTIPAPRCKIAPLTAAFLFAFVHGAAADSYLGALNDADCYTPEVLNEELALGYGQKPSGEMREYAGAWRSVMMYRNPGDKTWTLVGQPHEADARRLTKFNRLLCIIEGGEGEDYRKNQTYRRLMLGDSPKP